MQQYIQIDDLIGSSNTMQASAYTYYSEPKWQVDPEGLEKAKDLLNVTLPVGFRILDGTNSYSSMTGKYHGIGYWGISSDERLEVPTHHITLDGKQSLSSANEIAWHELTHAAQAEDYLPAEAQDGVEPYRIANKGMRMAFGEESRSLRSPGSGFGGKSYFDVSFEKEARHYMKNGDAISILVPIEKVDEEEKPDEEEDDRPDLRETYRVDMWTSDYERKHPKGMFVGTRYVRANNPKDAESWARDNYMKDYQYSSNIVAYRIIPHAQEKKG